MFSGVGIFIIGFLINIFKRNTSHQNQNMSLKQPIIISENQGENAVIGNNNNIILNENTQNGISQKNFEVSNQILDIVEKFIMVYEEHGISLKQMPSFIDEQFDVRYTDLISKESLLKKLDDNLINWTCSTFDIQRSWFDDDKTLYRSIDCYKNTHAFTSIISRLIDEVGVYGNYEFKIHVYALKDFGELKGDKTEPHSRILFVIRVCIGQTSTGNIYKYLLINNNLKWDYWKSRFDAKKIIAICKAFNLYVDGYDIPKLTLGYLGYDNLFPHKVIRSVTLGGFTWYPEDYISFNEHHHVLENKDLELDNLKEDIENIRKSIHKQIHDKKMNFSKSL